MSSDLDPRVARELLDEASRRSFYQFVRRAIGLVIAGELQPSWHHELLANACEDVFSRRTRRLLVAASPRSLKSIIHSVLFPAWALGRNPTLEFMCASYSLDLALKLARDSREVMRSAMYQRIFPRTRLNPAKQSEQEFLTTAGGGRRTVSIGSSVTGLGADHIVADDLLSAKDAYSKVAREACAEWLTRVARSRHNDPKTGTFSIVGQRMHQDDPIGRILETEPDTWRYIELCAIAEERQVFDLGRGRAKVREIGDLLEPGRMPATWLDEQKLVLGTADFNAQYQQRPIPEQGNLVRRDWFRTFSGEPPRPRQNRIIQSWDVAMKAESQHDHSVCVTALVGEPGYARGDIYILDVYRAKLTYPQLKRVVEALWNRWRPIDVVVEDRVSGTPLIQDLRQGGLVRPIAGNPEGDKIQRLSLQSAKIEQGRVFLPESAPWKDDFLAEVTGFPNGRHDDQVDALTQLLKHIDTKARRTVRYHHY